MLDNLASEAVVAWYNRLLQREDWARAALAAHAGRTARINAGPLSLILIVTAAGTLAGGGRVAGAGAAGSGDDPACALPGVTITLDPQALAGSFFEPAAALRNVHVEGDAAFAQVLTDVLPRLRPDPAEDLARLFGDATAERMVGAVNAALAQLREAAERLARQGADYLVGEYAVLVGTREFGQFCSEIKDLQTRIERVEQGVAALARRAPSA